MKKHLITLFFILMFLIGLGIMLYPMISNEINARNQSYAITAYSEQVEELSDDSIEEILAVAKDYNDRLYACPERFTHPEQVSGYENTLLVEGSDVMGVIRIERIGVEIPIRHGVSDDVLNKCAGHLEGTSLPIGGESTHSVIVAHRGLPSSKLFTNLDKLEEGDTFEISILGETLLYCVDQILIVDPDQIDQLQIVSGEDYCTLLTCTPYGINTHRLLVRGRRIESEEEVKTLYVKSNAIQIDPMKVAPFVGIVLLIIVGIFVYVLSFFQKIPKKKAKATKKKKEKEAAKAEKQAEKQAEKEVEEAIEKEVNQPKKEEEKA